MKQPNRPIFRSAALKHYLQSRERDVFPRLLSPVVFGFYWLLLTLLLLAIGIAWWGEVPVYASGSGLLFIATKTAAVKPKTQKISATKTPVVTTTATATETTVTPVATRTITKTATPKATVKHAVRVGQGEMQALIFVPVIVGQPMPRLHTHTPVLLENSVSNLQVNGEISSIDTDIVSPEAAKKRYKLTGDIDGLISQPSLVLHVHITTHLPTAMYDGSIVHASVPNGSLRLLSLLPGVNSLLGDVQ
jgi:hypothetical protein